MRDKRTMVKTVSKIQSILLPLWFMFSGDEPRDVTEMNAEDGRAEGCDPYHSVDH